MTGRRFYERLRDLVGHQLSMNPVPQAFKPLVDLYANTDSFTGRKIEGMGMERLQKRDRFTESTSEFARQFGKAGNITGLSPVQIDHLIRAYFGWIGTNAALLVDQAARPALGRPERPDIPFRKWTGGIAEDLDNDPIRSRYVTQFYEQSRRINEAYASLRAAQKGGDTERAQSLNERFDGTLTRQARRNNQMRKRMSELNAQRKDVASSAIDGSAKRIKLNRISAEMDRLARKLGPAAY